MDLQAIWLNIALLLSRVLQTTFEVPQYTNPQTNFRIGGLNVEYVLHNTCNMYHRLSSCRALNIHFLDRGFLGWRTQNWAYIVRCVGNYTQSCAIYKLRSGFAGWLAQHYTSIGLCPPNNNWSFAIYKLTDELHDLQDQN
jgi:hypothetical protein